VPLDKIKQKRKKAARQEQEQLNLFEDTTSGFVGGPALPMQSVQDLFDRLESTTNDTGQLSADIAKRKQYSIDEINRRFMGEATYFGPNWNPNNLATIVENTQTVYASTKEEAIEKINELYAKEQDTSSDLAKVSEKIGKFVKEDTVSEESILDQLRKINSCFK
jgi:hypothetical protein